MEEQVRNELRQEEAKKIVDTMNEEYNIGKVYEMIKDNKIEFDFEGKQYRVRLLNVKEKDELDTQRRKKFGQLMQDRDIMMEKDLIVIYKERGIDIEELDKEINRINKQIEDVNYKLGDALVKAPGDTILKTYKEEIIKLLNDFYEIQVKKNHLLEYSLENQLINHVAKVLSYLSLDILVGTDWTRAYNSIDEYLKADEKLLNLVAVYSTAIHNRI